MANKNNLVNNQNSKECHWIKWNKFELNKLYGMLGGKKDSKRHVMIRVQKYDI